MGTLSHLRRQNKERWKTGRKIMYEYYFAIMYDTPVIKRSCAGLVYKLDYKLDSTKKMVEFIEDLKSEGYKDPVILFFKQLNE